MHHSPPPLQNFRAKYFPGCAHVALGGDFNTCPQTNERDANGIAPGYDDGAAFGELEQAMGKSELQHALGAGNSKREWTATEKHATLDHVFVSRGWKVCEYSTIRVTNDQRGRSGPSQEMNLCASDHLGVRVKLQL